MTKVEYRKIVWGLLKDYRDNEEMTLVELLNKIMAIPTPGEKKNPYEGMATREDVTFNKKDKSRRY